VPQRLELLGTVDGEDVWGVHHVRIYWLYARSAAAAASSSATVRPA
jgi:hypothetical protein